MASSASIVVNIYWEISYREQVDSINSENNCIFANYYFLIEC